MKVRMLAPDKLGKVFEVPDEKAKDLIARGQAEAWQEPVMKTTSVPLVKRGSSS